jgi:hypothetical protein
MAGSSWTPTLWSGKSARWIPKRLLRQSRLHALQRRTRRLAFAGSPRACHQRLDLAQPREQIVLDRHAFSTPAHGKDYLARRSAKIRADQTSSISDRGGQTAVTRSVVPASDYRALQEQIRELHRLLGKKTLEAEILREALQRADPKKDCCCAGHCRRATVPGEGRGQDARRGAVQPGAEACTGTTPRPAACAGGRVARADQGDHRDAADPRHRRS